MNKSLSSKKLLLGKLNLRYERRRRGLTQNSLSKDLGISQQKYSLIERGSFSPDILLFQKILKRFDMSIEFKELGDV